MASRRRTIENAMRELCLAFPEAEEFESHGSPNFRARKGKVFAVWALNHHGDGHVGLWLNTPALEQSRLLASSRHLFKPPYVGPSGWIGIELNRGVSWKRVAELVALAYANSSPAKLVALVKKAPTVAAPTVKMKPQEIDRLKAPRALRTLGAPFGRALLPPLPPRRCQTRARALNSAALRGASGKNPLRPCTTTARASPRTSGWE
jgi:hypothetical protein